MNQHIIRGSHLHIQQLEQELTELKDLIGKVDALLDEDCLCCDVVMFKVRWDKLMQATRKEGIKPWQKNLDCHQMKSGKMY
jgi:hypothetical protein